MDYQPLQSVQSQIRLLTIHPRSSPHDQGLSDLVHCTLETVSLEDLRDEYRGFTDKLDPKFAFQRNTQAQWSESNSEDGTPSNKIELSPLSQAYRFKWGDYAALSYCWGEPANLKAIVVNNRVIHVTQNLEAALQALRKMAKFQKQYRLWVDAICINQQDLQEKSHQVRLVGEIYRRSWNVVVWIGPEEDFSNEGVDFFRVLAAYWPDHREIEDALQKDPKLFGVGGAHGMEILCLRPYWKRVWIIQELMSGNTETPVLCGSKIIEWDKMWKGLEVFTSMDKMAALVDADRRNIGIRNEGNAFGGIYCVIRLSKLMEMLFRSIDSPLIPVLIDCSRSSEATDNRDMTYGMLDLMEKRLASFIVPDYTKSASQVYASFVSAYIAAYDHVDVIRHGGLPKSAMHPTWAPDWSDSKAYQNELL